MIARITLEMALGKEFDYDARSTGRSRGPGKSRQGSFGSRGDGGGDRAPLPFLFPKLKAIIHVVGAGSLVTPRCWIWLAGWQVITAVRWRQPQKCPACRYEARKGGLEETTPHPGTGV